MLRLKHNKNIKPFVVTRTDTYSLAASHYSQRVVAAYVKSYMLREMIKVTFSFLLLLPNLVFAGGSYFEVQVTSIRTIDSKFQLVANVLDTFNYDSSDCKTIHIKGYFDRVKWKEYDAFINSQSHMRSLKILQNSKDKSLPISLGYIGAGLKKVGNCEYKSKGLFHDENGIISVYTRI